MSARTDADFIADLQKVLRIHGKLTTKTIRATPGVASPNSYFDRFGSLGKVYEAVGFKPSRGYFGGSIQRKKTESLKRSIIAEFARIFRCLGYKLQVIPHALYIRSLGIVGVEVVPQSVTRTGKASWVVNTGTRTRRRKMIAGRISPDHKSILEFVFLHNVPRTRCNFRLTLERMSNNPVGTAEQIAAVVLDRMRSRKASVLT